MSTTTARQKPVFIPATHIHDVSTRQRKISPLFAEQLGDEEIMRLNNLTADELRLIREGIEEAKTGKAIPIKDIHDIWNCIASDGEIMRDNHLSAKELRDIKEGICESQRGETIPMRDDESLDDFLNRINNTCSHYGAL